MPKSINRRAFVAAASSAGLAPRLGTAAAPGRLALLGGEPVRTDPFPSWPKHDRTEEDALLEVLRSGQWNRSAGGAVELFEKQYAGLMGAPHCLATANGTSALLTSLNALDVGPGDEVLVPPYTFVATVNVVLLQHAVPVFVDTDIESFQMDSTKIEQRRTDRTAAVIPVHLGGGACDMDAIARIAKRWKLPVIEDACQAHLGEWRGRKLGTLGDAGCFSFQASKNLNSGEGGALLTTDSQLFQRAYAFHNNGRGHKAASYDFTYRSGGANLRLTAFQARLLLAQMTRIEEQSRLREQNAAYLTTLLKQVPGLAPARAYQGCTRNAWHLFMFRYAPEAFAGVPRDTFLQAMRAEGIPCSGGYTPLNKQPFLRQTILSKAYRAIYPGRYLEEWEERNRCPVNEKLCDSAVWLTQTMLLGTRSGMEQIAEAARKVQAGAADLRKS